MLHIQPLPQVVEDVSPPLPLSTPMLLVKPPVGLATPKIFKSLDLAKRSTADPLKLMADMATSGKMSQVGNMRMYKRTYIKLPIW